MQSLQKWLVFLFLCYKRYLLHHLENNLHTTFSKRTSKTSVHSLSFRHEVAFKYKQTHKSPIGPWGKSTSELFNLMRRALI